MTKLGIDSLMEFKNGMIPASFNRELEEAVADLKNRPEVGASRDVTLQIRIKPADISGGILETVSVAFNMKCKIPPKQLTGCEMKVLGGKGSESLFFNPESPRNPHQGTLDDEEKRTEKISRNSTSVRTRA